MAVNIIGIPSQFVVRWLLERNPGLDTWADLGSGNGEYLTVIGFKPGSGIAIDVKEPKVLPPNFSFFKSDLVQWLWNQKKKFDVITMFDVIEHFEKEKALNLIKKSKESARIVVVSTPSGFVKQNAETHPEDKDNPWNWHRSGFLPGELESLGFLVFSLKNYHYKFPGNEGVFDKIVAIWTADALNYPELVKSVKNKTFLYLLKPRHLYRMLMDYVIKPLFA